MRHCYLFAIEVEPLRVGTVYDELPLHCTLMHRFWSDLSPSELAHKTRAVFIRTPPLILDVVERKYLGPKRIRASILKLTPELEKLNMHLYNLLNELGVEYTEPRFVGINHIFHVSDQGQEQLAIGTCLNSKTIYLVEVKVAGLEHKRVVRRRFDLSAKKL